MSLTLKVIWIDLAKQNTISHRDVKSEWCFIHLRRISAVSPEAEGKTSSFQVHSQTGDCKDWGGGEDL